MKTRQTRSILIVLISVVAVALLVTTYFFIKNRVDASTNGVTCPALAPMLQGWCPDGHIENQSNDANGCPRPPRCLTNDVSSYTFNLSHGWNTVVMPQSMFDINNPISTSPFRLTDLKLYSFSGNQWEVWPTYLRVNGSYLILNNGQDTSVTIEADGSIMTGVYNGYKLNPGWNLVGNNDQFAKSPSDFDFVTYQTKASCTTSPLCNETKTISQLFAEGRIYNKIFFFNNLTSTDPNVFYTAKTLTSGDLTTYQIPALSAFWIYLYK